MQLLMVTPCITLHLIASSGEIVGGFCHSRFGWLVQLGWLATGSGLMVAAGPYINSWITLLVHGHDRWFLHVSTITCLNLSFSPPDLSKGLVGL